MRRTSVCAALVIAMGTTVFAQPGPPPGPAPYAQPSPYPPPYPAAGYPPPGYVPPPQVQVQLTVEEQELLERGEITDGQYLGGGLAALFIGFGVGQAVQGRWAEKGWIFTLGEGASIGVMIWGMSQFVGCASDIDNPDADNCAGSGFGLMFGGMLGLSVFRIWETVDAFLAPPEHNRRVHDLQIRAGLRPMYSRLTPYLTPPKLGDGAIAGVTFAF